MKKFTFTLLAIVVITFTSKAQGLRIIPKAGLTLSKYAFSDNLKNNESIKSLTGFTGGVAFEIGLSKENRLSLQPELLFIQKGVKSESTSLNSTSKATLQFNHIEVPILIKYAFGDEDKVRLYVYGGPYFAYNIGGKYKGETSNMSLSGKIKWTNDDPKNINNNSNDLYISTKNNRRTDFGINVGLGLSIPAGPGAFIIDGRYGYGLVNLEKVPDGSTQSKSDYKSQNRVFAFTVGYSIKLGK